MKRIGFISAILIIYYLVPTQQINAAELETVIIEVEGDVSEHEEYIKSYHPFITIIDTYSTIFNGLALEGKPENLAKMESLDFIKAVHGVNLYQPLPASSLLEPKNNVNLPKEADPLTAYTGKNSKVAVIDTGIDYTHPDLKENYIKGYDVFDLDDDPMETQAEEGIPTSHGTHVAGIIAANGKLKGVAENAEIYAYRALGPGGYGSSVHVLAALEQAVLDDVDMINLSLGNSVNGPDYPTSTAVNKAVEFGIPVVIANGNSGPATWTVGAPATAENALSVGAATEPTEVPYLYHSSEKKHIPILEMQGAPSWDLSTDYMLINADEPNPDLNGNLAIYKRGITPFHEFAMQAQARGAVGVLIYNNETGPLHGMIEQKDWGVTIPVAGISKEAGEWLIQHSGEYIETVYKEIDTTIADFSSRGPVTVNWQIKPDILAPGTNILSTVPGGHEALSGTSMAAPYVTGAIALMKEAHPDWKAEKIYNALKTTASPLTDENQKLLAPNIQGHGLIQPAAAIDTPFIIHDAAIQFGKITDRREKKEFDIKIENLSQEEQQFSFNIPKKQAGLNWKLPLTFTVQPQELKSIALELTVTSPELTEGLHQGYLELVEQAENETYHLPYLLVNQEAGQPKTFGFEFSLKRFSEDTYVYRLYATEELRTFTVDLYDPDTLNYKGQLFEMENATIGMNEGEIPRKQVTPGIYTAVITAVTEEGIIESQETMIHLE